jgi:peptidyl-prolyl cis-trans isomerase D
MLQFLRKTVTSWVGILILALALGALVFTLFQPTGPGGSTAASGQLLATVGDASVTEADYRRTIDRAVAR